VGDPVVAGLAQKLAEYEVQKGTLLVDYTEAHPAVQTISKQIVEVQQKMLATYKTNLLGLDNQLKALQTELARYEAQLKQMPEAERNLVHLVRQAKVNADIYTFLLEKHEEARILKASTLGNIDIIDQAITPGSPIKPQKKKNLLLGLVLGAMLGIGVAFFVEYLDDTVTDPEMVKRLLGLPIL
ncbi:MAG: GNVR domain-containing protein, partial [Desulfurivibrionaceae bacterium]|nr:GNVR domain-containing protein [Desulfurivibrionaceae bacterium]